MTLEELLKKKELTGQFRGIATMAQTSKSPHISISYNSFEMLLEEIDDLSRSLYMATEALKEKND